MVSFQRICNRLDRRRVFRTSRLPSRHLQSFEKLQLENWLIHIQKFSGQI